MTIAESRSEFRPVFAIDLADQTINNIVFTRSRYAKQMCFGLVCSWATFQYPIGMDEQALLITFFV